MDKLEIYEAEKKKLQEAGLSHEEYQQRVKELAELLGV